MDCDFSYRNSRFKSADKDRFFITSITLALTKNKPMPPFYASVQTWLDKNGVKQPTSDEIRKAVIEIRTSKLPDPAEVANCGSFFKNPLVDLDTAAQILETFPEIPHWATNEGKTKLSAAWMLEQLGLKGYHEPNTGMYVWDKQPLVLVNEKAPNTASLVAFRDAIIKSVKDKFGVTLEQEPELI
jgi:UDP-N-acetylmuramate dehydrogenase